MIIKNAMMRKEEKRIDMRKWNEKLVLVKKEERVRSLKIIGLCQMQCQWRVKERRGDNIAAWNGL